MNSFEIKKDDHIYLADLYESLSGIPVRLISEGKVLRSSMIMPEEYDPFQIAQDQILSSDEHIGYCVTSAFLAYGRVKSDDVIYVFGPVFQIMPKESVLRRLAFECDVPSGETERFMDCFQKIRRQPLETLLMHLCALNYTLNHEQVGISDLSIHENEQSGFKSDVENERTRRIYDGLSENVQNNSLQIEHEITDMISHGDTQRLKEWIAHVPSLQNGILAADQLRQIKNTFVVSATLFSRAAIQGGMDSEEALGLSDSYIMRAEQLYTQAAITDLQYNMVLEFAEQVQRIRMNEYPSKLAIQAANYVRRHLSEPMDTEKMAKAFYMSRTYFSAKFRQETGMTLTDFILSEKTKEAMRLLTYSDKKAAAISSYLGFSSQSHFSRVFRKYAGCTPQEYRERSGKKTHSNGKR